MLQVPKKDNLGRRFYGCLADDEILRNCIASTPLYGLIECRCQCSRKRGHGPGGLFCKQHGAKAEQAGWREE